MASFHCNYPLHRLLWFAVFSGHGKTSVLARTELQTTSDRMQHQGCSRHSPRSLARHPVAQ